MKNRYHNIFYFYEMNIASYIDHTLLKPIATFQDIEILCDEAKQYSFYAVCVNGCYTPFAKNLLQGTSVKLATVVGFPLGAHESGIKRQESVKAVEQGADEVDMVLNIGFLKSGKFSECEREITDIKKSIGNAVLKVIIETCYLTEEEKKTATKIVWNSGADFIKTSTGFGTAGATIEDIQLFSSILQGNVKIKASGGIKDVATAQKYIALGVSRLGTSSGVEIVKGILSNKTY